MTMTPDFENIKSSIDVVGALRALAYMARNGHDVGDKISECFQLADAMPCDTQIDVLAFFTLAQYLYAEGMGFAALQHPGASAFLTEANRYAGRAIAFLEKETNLHVPDLAQRRKAMN